MAAVVPLKSNVGLATALAPSADLRNATWCASCLATIFADLADEGLLGSAQSYVNRVAPHRLLTTALSAVIGAAGIGLVHSGDARSSVGRTTGARRPPTALRLSRAPYAGVRCPVGNSIACDRISLAVWLAGRPIRLIATIGGRQIVMQPPSEAAGRSYWEGTLDHAGLLVPGPLHVTPDGGNSYWAGRHPRALVLSLSARYSNRLVAGARIRVMLRPGWG